MATADDEGLTFESFPCAANGNNTGIVVPDEVVEQLGAWSSARPLLVDRQRVQPTGARSTVMGGQFLIGRQCRGARRHGARGW